MIPQPPWPTYGYPQFLWDEAKRITRSAIIDRIRLNGDFLTYTEVLVLTSRFIDFADPHNPLLANMLGQISNDEEAAGRGLLTAYVVRRDLNRPGNGYFELAAIHGRDAFDQTRCWTEEIRGLQKHWQNSTARP
jgi:hypothetical protein